MTLEELFLKYLEDRLSPEEFHLFCQEVARKENKATLDRLLARWIQQDFPSPQPEALDIEALYADLIDKHAIPSTSLESPVSSPTTIIPIDPRSTTPAPTRRIPRRALAIAAACLLGFTGLFLFRQRPTRIRITPPVTTTPVIQPAGNKAILRLANGSSLILDSASNGQLAQQGSTQIMKLGGGRIAYQAAAGSEKDNSPLLYNEMITPRGGYYQLILPDGSKVWLDASSSIRFPTVFREKDRSVEISGEAYFEIAADRNRPFLITTNGVNIQVLGTSFNVMAYSDEEAVRTTLVEGGVEVSHGTDHRRINPGQQASWIRNSNTLVLSTPDLHEVLAWKEGEFRFEGLKIPAIMRQIARWYDVDIEFRGPQPKGEFNGVIPRKKEVSELLTVLEQTDEVHFTVSGRKIIVEAATGK